MQSLHDLEINYQEKIIISLVTCLFILFLVKVFGIQSSAQNMPSTLQATIEGILQISTKFINYCS